MAKIAFNLIAARNARRYALQLWGVADGHKKMHSYATLMTSSLHGSGYTSDTAYHKGKVPMFTRYVREERCRRLVNELDLFGCRNGYDLESGEPIAELLKRAG